MESSIADGVIIGATGGALAGIMVYAIQYVHTKAVNCIESERICDWLDENTGRNEFRSTRAISSWTNIPMDRVQYLCSHEPSIKLSTGINEDMWGLRAKISEATFE